MNERIAPVIAETEIMRQNRIIQSIRAQNEKDTRQKTYFILTMGCQMNAHDSEKLSGMLTEMGYQETQDEATADLVLYNTCSIRENADQKVYGRLGALKSLKKQHPDRIIALCGCMMQQDAVLSAIQKSYRHVDILFGTFNLYKLPELLEKYLAERKMVIDIWQEAQDIVEELPQIRKYSFKACVNVVYGCNNFCAYCIVPYVRGRERSRNPEDILSEVRTLAQDGVKEIMLLGQNVNSYGKSLETPMNFADLLRRINEIEGIERIRFMTSHPKDFSDELIAAMRDCDKVCPSLHLPVQSGSNRILYRMNRSYTKETYLTAVNKVKQAIPDLSLSTDIIVGFPGETEEDFLETLDVVSQVGYSTAFTFLYSKRTGTPAASMPDQIPDEVAKARFQRLLETLNAGIHAVQARQEGTVAWVLAEEMNEAKGLLSGRTAQNTLVHFSGTKELVGQMVLVRLKENKTFYFIGEQVREKG